MGELTINAKLTKDQIERIRDIFYEVGECRSPYCECEKDKCSSGCIDKRGEPAKSIEKDPRQFSVVPRSLSENALRQIANQVRTRNFDLLEDNIEDAFKLFIANYAVSVKTGSIATVPYAESTLKTRRKWVEFCSDIYKMFPDSKIGRRAHSIMDEIERSIQFGRPINYINGMLLTPSCEVEKPKTLEEKWEEILCKYIDQ